MKYKLNSAIETIYIFMVLNFCFFLSNLLFLLTTVIIRPIIITIPIFILSSLTIGPSLSALLVSLDKIKERYSINNFFKNYFIAFKKNFKTTVFYTLMLEIMLIVLFIDIQFFNRFPLLNWLLWLSFVIILFLISMYCQYIYDYSIHNINHLKSFDSFKISIQLFFSNWLYIFTIGIIIIAFIFILIIKPIVGYFFIPSIITFVVLWFQKYTIRRIIPD